MKHSNQKEATKNQGASSDHNKKTNKSQRNEKNDSISGGQQHAQGGRDHGSMQDGSGSD